MIKDEPTGLWRGLKSNPLAVVTLRQIDNKDYSIVGVRLGDKMVSTQTSAIIYTRKLVYLLYTDHLALC